MADMAPDDAGVFKALGLIPRPAKELAADERARTDYNVMQLVSSIAVAQKNTAETKKSQTEFQKEVLRRLADQQLSSPASSASLNLNTTADILRLKKLMADSREALSKLTGVVNGLVNIPASLANIEHVVQELRAGQASRQMSLTARAPESTPAQTSPTAHTIETVASHSRTDVDNRGRSASKQQDSSGGSRTKRSRPPPVMNPRSASNQAR
jgi:hypothetical protein